MKVENWGTTIAITGIKSAKEVDQFWPGFSSQVWPQVKAECGTKQQKPRAIYLSEEAQPMHANDYDLAQRIIVDLSNNLMQGSAYMSTGENAINNMGRDREVTDIPTNMALLDCTWSDYYRTFSIRVQVPKGGLTKMLPNKTAQDMEKGIKNQLKEMEKAEIPQIDQEIAVQRLYPENEHEVIPHGEHKAQKGDVPASTSSPILIDSSFDEYTSQAMAKVGIGSAIIGWRWQLSQSATPEWTINEKPADEKQINKLFGGREDAAYTLTLGLMNMMNKHPGFTEALHKNLDEPESTQWSPSVVQAAKLQTLADKAFAQFYRRK